VRWSEAGRPWSMAFDYNVQLLLLSSRASIAHSDMARCTYGTSGGLALKVTGVVLSALTCRPALVVFLCPLPDSLFTSIRLPLYEGMREGAVSQTSFKRSSRSHFQHLRYHYNYNNGGGSGARGNRCTASPYACTQVHAWCVQASMQLDDPGNIG
jgi:hypothetical protein